MDVKFSMFTDQWSTIIVPFMDNTSLCTEKRTKHAFPLGGWGLLTLLFYCSCIAWCPLSFLSPRPSMTSLPSWMHCLSALWRWWARTWKISQSTGQTSSECCSRSHSTASPVKGGKQEQEGILQKGRERRGVASCPGCMGGENAAWYMLFVHVCPYSLVRVLAIKDFVSLKLGGYEGFYSVHSINVHTQYFHDILLHILCSTVLMKIPPSQFKLLMDSIVWAFKHTMRNVAEIGLNILLTLLQKFSRDQMGTQFFQTYFIDLMQHIFSVVTDSSHSASTYCALSAHYLTLSVLLLRGATFTLHMAMQDVWTYM